MFPYVIIRQMLKGVFDHKDSQSSKYWQGDTLRTTRPETYKTLKRRNRLMRKFHHNSNSGDKN
jgi:hypothetical protein